MKNCRGSSLYMSGTLSSAGCPFFYVSLSIGNIDLTLRLTSAGADIERMKIMEGNKTGVHAEGYDCVARDVFMPLFPVIARKALDVYGHTEGVCLDIGSGGGLFGYNVALQSKMNIYFLDIQPQAIDICMRRGREWGLSSRCVFSIPAGAADAATIVSTLRWQNGARC